MMKHIQNRHPHKKHTHTHIQKETHTRNIFMRYILIVTCMMSHPFVRYSLLSVCFYYLISREGSSSFGKNNGARNQALPRSVARLVPKLFFVSKSREKAYVDFPSRSEGKRNGSVKHVTPKILPRIA